MHFENNKQTIDVIFAASNAFISFCFSLPKGTIVVNVASFKNVDEESLLKIPRVLYVPQVGKVTVAMLERNLMRLFEQFHHPDVLYRHLLEKPKQQPWYGNLLNLYTAAAVTLLIALHVAKK